MTDYADKNRLDRLEAAVASLTERVNATERVNLSQWDELQTLRRKLESRHEGVGVVTFDGDLKPVLPPEESRHEEPTADPVCAREGCGHLESQHIEDIGGDSCNLCSCRQFMVPESAPPAAPEIVQCPVCGAMVNEFTLVTGVWEGEPHCNCQPVSPPAAPDLDPVLVAMQLVYESVDRFSRLADEIRGEWHERTGRPNVITDVAIRAYGQQVTR